MSANEELEKKIPSIEYELIKNKNKVLSHLKEYQNTISIEYEKFLKKIKKNCEERMKYYSSANEENKSSIYNDTMNDLDNLIKENGKFVNNLMFSMSSFKSYIS